MPETTGRLFFTVGDTDYICTATVVASDNMSVISTARHCGFNDGGTNYRYAPSYNAGDAPHGWWDWNTAGWVVGGDGIHPVRGRCLQRSGGATAHGQL